MKTFVIINDGVLQKCRALGIKEKDVHFMARLARNKEYGLISETKTLRGSSNEVYVFCKTGRFRNGLPEISLKNVYIAG